MLSSSCRNFRQTILGHITDHIRLFICLGDTRSHNSSVAEEEYNSSAVSDEEEHNLSQLSILHNSVFHHLISSHH